MLSLDLRGAVLTVFSKKELRGLPETFVEALT